MPIKRANRARSWRGLWRSISGAAALFGALSLAAGPCLAHGQRDIPKMPRNARRAPVRAQRRAARQARTAQDRHAHPPGYLSRLRELPPQEQERILANDQRFQNLPPARQQQIRENLQRWNSLSPEQKDLIRQREEILQSLSPEKQQQVRAIAPRWRQLSPDRRQALMGAFRRLRDMPSKKRDKFLSSREIKKSFSPEERGVLRDLSSLLPD